MYDSVLQQQFDALTTVLEDSHPQVRAVAAKVKFAVIVSNFTEFYAGFPYVVVGSTVAGASFRKRLLAYHRHMCRISIGASEGVFEDTAKTELSLVNHGINYPFSRG